MAHQASAVSTRLGLGAGRRWRVDERRSIADARYDDEQNGKVSAHAQPRPRAFALSASQGDTDQSATGSIGSRNARRGARALFARSSCPALHFPSALQRPIMTAKEFSQPRKWLILLGKTAKLALNRNQASWRNWQTRWIQNPVPERAYRFDSDRGHSHRIQIETHGRRAETAWCSC